MRLIIVAVAALAAAAPSAAQTRPEPPRRPVATSTEPSFWVRGLVMGAEQQFSAKTTFEATFGRSAQPFWGGGVQVVFRKGAFVELGVSRFSRTGERAFLSNGQTFRLGIPLTAQITPIELSGGYRFRLKRHQNVIPYVGAGLGWYSYRETSSSSDSGENVDTQKSGYLANAGVELRLHRWVGVSVDAQYTHIPGILGTGGISQVANENDLGGGAARFKLIIGRR